MDEKEIVLQEVLLQMNHLSGDENDMLHYAASQLMRAMTALAEDTSYAGTSHRIVAAYAGICEVEVTA